MNKFHVSLLAVLCVVFGVNAAGFSLQEQLKTIESGIKADTKNSQKLLISGKDALVYNYAPDVVGRVTGAVNYVTRDFIKNNLQALFADVANKKPNAVNAANANRVLTEGLVKVLFANAEVSQDGNAYFIVKAPLTLENIKKDGKAAVDSMKDAALAIAAVEVLALPANLAINTFAGEHAETIFGYASYARTVTYAVCKQLSATCMFKIFA